MSNWTSKRDVHVGLLLTDDEIDGIVRLTANGIMVNRHVLFEDDSTSVSWSFTPVHDAVDEDEAPE